MAEVATRLKLSHTCRHIYILASISFKRKNTGYCFNLIDWRHGRERSFSVTSSFMKKLIFCELPSAVRPFLLLCCLLFPFFYPASFLVFLFL